MEEYDAIIIGAGQAGTPLSTALAQAGFKTALIEREHVGGTCVNEGCTPTKTMVASARVAHLVGRAADYGINTSAISVDLTKVNERKQKVVDQFRNGSQNYIEEMAGVDLIFGEAQFTDEKTIVVRPLGDGGDVGEERRLRAEKVFINTGASHADPPIPGLADVPTLNSTTIMELTELPEHLLVIGGGYIGVEFGQMFRRFGSRVTIVQRGGQLLAREDGDVAEEVANVFRDEGIDVLLNSDARRVERGEDGSIQAVIQTTGDSLGDSEAQERTITVSHLLLAVGRRPNTDALNLDATGVTVDKRGFIPVNDRLETNVAGIYALGDVKGGPAFTHISYDDFRVIRTNVIQSGEGDGPSTIAGRLVPYTVFTDPQVGRVGLSESEARDAGYSIKVAKLPMSRVARAIETDETRGFMKAVVDAETKQILGCAIVGVEGGEIMSVLQMAMMGNVPYTTIRDGVFAHPTFAESLNNLFSSI